MKKRILSCFMALALCLTLLPTAALAADAEQAHPDHPICGKNCSHTGETAHPDAFTNAKWLSSDNYGLRIAEGETQDGKPLEKDKNCWKLPAGTYYLLEGAEHSSTLWISLPIVIDGEVTICLNGKTIQSTGAGAVFRVTGSGKLTLTDCSDKGKVQHFGVTDDDPIGSGVEVENGGTFNMYGGKITGNTATLQGGGVCVTGARGTFNMYGGTITKNTANHGGGVYVEGGKFTMDGTSSITDNTANSNGNGTSGGVYVSNNGTFTMNGGTISRNTADSTDGGVGVYRGTAPAKFEMNGGTITGNQASQGGGVGVHGKDSAFIMNNNASVSGNTAKNGGGVYVSVSGKGTFNMNDNASVTRNTASGDKADQGNGGGVFVNSGTFEMNGSASVSNNTATNTEETNTTYGGGVYVKSGTFTMNGEATSVSNNTAKNGGGV